MNRGKHCITKLEIRCISPEFSKKIRSLCSHKFVLNLY